MATSQPTTLASATEQGSTAMADCTAKVEFEGQPYLQRLQSLEHAFPALKAFLDKIKNVDAGRQLVQDHYQGRAPGRCYCLQFEADRVSPLEGYPSGFQSPAALRNYLQDHSTKASRECNQRRLFILEDMEPDYVDALGDHLGVDPLVFSEQMNTWNFTDSRSIPHRGLPSVSLPNQSFTLRYYETRTLDDPSSVDKLRAQMTFAINRRKYERWRDIDLPSFRDKPKDNRHAFVRRCASFWTSQEQVSPEKTSQGWDVDPGIAAARVAPQTAWILRDSRTYDNRASLWYARTWEQREDVERVEHKSWAYHDGCPTLAPLLFPQISSEAQDEIRKFQTKRDLVSALDETVFYWTKIASKDLISQTNKESSNAAYYLLKHLAQHWINQLELINCTLAKGEYLSDDFQAKIDDTLSGAEWKADLLQINDINNDINYMRRQMNYFWRATVLNLERIGIQLGCEKVDKGLSVALQGAQKDFLTISSRLQQLRQRVDAISAMANDLANLRAAFKGIHDGDLALWLSIFASIIFPLTLVASILSMGDDFLPGKDKFWIFWASSLSLAILFASFLVYGKWPHRLLGDLKELMKTHGRRKPTVECTEAERAIKERGWLRRKIQAISHRSEV